MKAQEKGLVAFFLRYMNLGVDLSLQLYCEEDAGAAGPGAGVQHGAARPAPHLPHPRLAPAQGQSRQLTFASFITYGLLDLQRSLNQSLISYKIECEIAKAILTRSIKQWDRALL